MDLLVTIILFHCWKGRDMRVSLSILWDASPHLWMSWCIHGRHKSFNRIFLQLFDQSLQHTTGRNWFLLALEYLNQRRSVFFYNFYAPGSGRKQTIPILWSPLNDMKYDNSHANIFLLLAFNEMEWSLSFHVFNGGFPTSIMPVAWFAAMCWVSFQDVASTHSKTTAIWPSLMWKTLSTMLDYSNRQ